MHKKGPAEPRFQRRDLAEIAVGACIMAFPVAATEEVWNLGASLPLLRVMLFALASVFSLAVFIFVLHDHGPAQLASKVYLQRIAGTYGITLLISALLLLGVDQLNLMQDPLIAIKRIILVAFPASFAATAVDSFSDKT